MKKIIKELYPYVIIVIVVVLFRTFIATPVRVDGDSMNTTLKNKDIVILNKLDKSIERFDIVIIDFDGYKLVKRVIALPGESIKYEDNSFEILLNIKPSKLICITKKYFIIFLKKDVKNVDFLKLY